MDGLRSFTEVDNRIAVDEGGKSIQVKKPQFNEDFPDAVIREGADELILRAKEVGSLRTFIGTNQVELERWGPPLVDANWHAFCQECGISRNEKFLESISSLRGRHSSRKSKKQSPRRLLQRNVRKSGMISVRQETERGTALVDTLRPRISIFVETVMMINLTRFQNQSQIVQSSGTSWMIKNKKL